MTCFRLQNGETVHQWCKKNNILYDSFWNRIEKGYSFEDSIKGAKEARGQKNSHPKYFYNGKSVVSICGGSKTNLYGRVYEKIKKGISVEEALRYEGVI